MPVRVNNTRAVYFNYHTTVWIAGKYDYSTLHNFDIQWEVDENDNGQPGSGSVTIYNIAPQNINKWKVKNHISIWDGPPTLFGEVGAGNITKISQSLDGRDKSVTISFQEAANYGTLGAIKDKKTQSTKSSRNTKSKGKATKKSINKTKLVNHTFPKNVKAKTIINYILRKTKIKVSRFKLKQNKTYKRGYTLSKRPFQALQGLVSDCNSLLYYRDDQLIIDDGKADNPFHEHLFLSLGSGLTAQPSLTSKQTKTIKNKRTNKSQKVNTASIYTVEAWEDPRIKPGSYVRIDSKTLKNYCRVKSVKHSLDDSNGYTMEMTVSV